MNNVLPKGQVTDQRFEWAEQEWVVQYTEAVRNYLAGGGENALRRAYNLGKEAIRKQVSLAALTAIHHKVLARLLPQPIAVPEEASFTRQVEEFFREVLAPFEMVLRGYDRALIKLRRLNKSLKQVNRRFRDADRARSQAVEDLQRKEKALRRSHAALEDQLQVQSAELTAAGETLRAEMAERKLTEIASRESEARLQVLFERAGIGIGVLDKGGGITETNLAFRQMLGYTGDELSGTSLFGLTHPDDLEASLQGFRDLAEGKYRHYKLEKRFIRKDGSVLWVRKITLGVYGFRGELQFAIGMIEDISDSKRAELALRESESRFRQVAEMTAEWIWDLDAQGRYLYSSSAVRSILGYAPEEIIGKYYYELFLPEDGEHAARLAPDVLARKETFLRIITRYRHKDGHEVFTESSGTPILDAEGRVLKWRGMDHDITERKRFEDALGLRDRAIEASSVGIIITDPNLRENPIIYANPAFIQMTGRGRDEVIGRNPRFLQGPGTDPRAVETIREALREGCDCHLTLKNYRKDGTPFWNELFISPVRDVNGKLTHFIGTQTDVTALRRMEEERYEMEIARQVQLSFLPSAPLQMDGVQVAGFCLPAVHVGGDYFDFFSAEDTVDIVIADVSGHSVGAAMIMAEARSTLKMETHWMLSRKIGLANGPAETLRVLNELLYEDLNQADSFISMFYIKYDVDTHEVRYANAGHNRPLLLRQGGRECLELDAEGLILGVKQRVNFEERKFSLYEGDTLLLYTDGIIDAQNEAGDFFGTHRLHDIFVAHSQSPPQEIINVVVQELESFCQSESFTDDISLVVLKAA
jgi:sigma-B regulation protein RsbU (phosphoserine phosphatase)